MTLSTLIKNRSRRKKPEGITLCGKDQKIQTSKMVDLHKCGWVGSHTTEREREVDGVERIPLESNREIDGSGAILYMYYNVMANRTDPLISRKTCRHTIFTVGELQTSML